MKPLIHDPDGYSSTAAPGCAAQLRFFSFSNTGTRAADTSAFERFDDVGRQHVLRGCGMVVRLQMRIAGIILLVMGTVGFVAVADDLRHVGEVAGVASLAIAGVALVAASVPNRVSRSLALPWIAVAVLVGALIGAMIDRMALSVCAGAVAGFLLAALLRPPHFPAP